MSIEADNAKEEIKELIEKCIECGLCKGRCPVFKVLREEAGGARGKVIMLKNDIYDRSFFDCCLCGACEEECPLNLKLCDAFRKARQVLVGMNKESKSGKEMVKNLKKSGNVFGED